MTDALTTPIPTARECRPIQASPSSTLVDEVTRQEDVNARDLATGIVDTHDVQVSSSWFVSDKLETREKSRLLLIQMYRYLQ